MHARRSVIGAHTLFGVNELEYLCLAVAASDNSTEPVIVADVI